MIHHLPNNISLSIDYIILLWTNTLHTLKSDMSESFFLISFFFWINLLILSTKERCRIWIYSHSYFTRYTERVTKSRFPLWRGIPVNLYKPSDKVTSAFPYHYHVWVPVSPSLRFVSRTCHNGSYLNRTGCKNLWTTLCDKPESKSPGTYPTRRISVFKEK